MTGQTTHYKALLPVVGAVEALQALGSPLQATPTHLSLARWERKGGKKGGVELWILNLQIPRPFLVPVATLILI